MNFSDACLLKPEEVLRYYKAFSFYYRTLKEEYYALKSAGDIHVQDYSEKVNSGNKISMPVEEYNAKLDGLLDKIKEIYIYIQSVNSLITELRNPANILDKAKSDIALEIISSHFWKYESLEFISKKICIDISDLEKIKNYTLCRLRFSMDSKIADVRALTM
ncbi:MAG: hypothetical protein IJP97_04845 [Synergistaceae bacterium]|nr:hypothetical protein [Synergistaceae bacterium]MBQ3693765.1 hypothetical protein [Synergistaceae bacterium]MBQ6111605.1 hypothetical protein [Synergistaceae bacterium]MBQ9628355.1 hypothetical protein [Synergistaceae bacterium]MBR0069804.1 hypothetical protein [Synergistaceae bacterium]